jgi:hypothetical protein
MGRDGVTAGLPKPAVNSDSSTRGGNWVESGGWSAVEQFRPRETEEKVPGLQSGARCRSSEGEPGWRMARIRIRAIDNR